MISKKITLEVLKAYWLDNVKLAFSKYSDIEFPFESLTLPRFVHTQEWNMQQMENYMLSWSASQLYIDRNDANPVDEIREELIESWGDPEHSRAVSWELYMKVGRKTS